jgi:hypothetical protein
VTGGARDCGMDHDLDGFYYAEELCCNCGLIRLGVYEWYEGTSTRRQLSIRQARELGYRFRSG